MLDTIESTQTTTPESAPAASPKPDAASTPAPQEAPRDQYGIAGELDEAKAREVFDRLAKPADGESADFNSLLAEITGKGDEPAAEPAPQQKPQGTADAPTADNPDQAQRERTRFTLAKRALLRSGILQESDIAAWKPEEIIARGEKAARMQAETDKAFAAMKGKNAGKPPKGEPDDWADPADTGETGPETDPEADTGNEDDTTGAAGNGRNGTRATPATRAQIERLIKEEALAPETAKQLRGLVASLERRASETSVNAERQIAEAQTKLARARIGVVHSELKGEIAGLADKDSIAKVLDWMARHDPENRIVLEGDDADLKSYMRDAAYAVLGPAQAAQVRKQLIEGNKAARNGQPAAPVSASSSTVAIDENQHAQLVAAAITQANGDQGTLARLMAKIPAPTKR